MTTGVFRLRCQLVLIYHKLFFLLYIAKFDVEHLKKNYIGLNEEQYKKKIKSFKFASDSFNVIFHRKQKLLLPFFSLSYSSKVIQYTYVKKLFDKISFFFVI